LKNLALSRFLFKGNFSILAKAGANPKKRISGANPTTSGANPTIESYNVTSSLPGFETIFSFFDLKKRSSLLQRWRYI
jgi:hypothetical protein